MRQLILPVQLRDDATFSNFIAGKNQAIVEYLKNPQERAIFLSGAGKTHILQALCHQAIRSFYLPLREHTQYSPDILQNLGELDWITLDDIDAISGLRPWEEAIFHVFNTTKPYLAFSSALPPQRLCITLPDLSSRIKSMLFLKLDDLSDEERMAALSLRAERQGFHLSKEVQQYLLYHTPRDMTSLFHCLQKLGTLSLSEKRRLTVPFVKQVLCKT
jgi:DnaA family protein